MPPSELVVAPLQTLNSLRVNRLQRTTNDESDTTSDTVYDRSVRTNEHLFYRTALALVAASWAWKFVEYSAREARWLDRNLGWGFYVDFTIPAAATIVFLLFVALRRIARLLVRQVLC